ncbi:EAL domain-containing protein [Bacillus mesophilus]|uniref:EAL domain-containing protein n=2 Tax=Bacillus mesophilus TaxID=1808955 RepID=A0A6M0Q608_9BACI|nr:EAL domain-containing protein [Bacillus mesophilus]
MINLYYLSKYSVKRKLLRLVLVGFFLQVLADSIFAHQTILGTYQTGGFIDVIWLLSLLLIGYSGYYSLRTPLQQQDEILEEEVKDTFLPYISVLILLVFVMYSYKWEFNALSIGFTIIFLMIIARLHFIFKKNQRLINEYRFLAFHDPLTGLNNRSSFKNDLNSLLKIFDGNQDRSISLMLVDLDGFKNINDSLGHYIGDLLLKETAVRLQKCIGNTNMVYRLGGDEFIIILPHTTKEEATFIAKGILNDFSTSFLIQEHELNITPSIGITLYPQNGENGETLFKEADVALYQVKENGRNNFYFYNSVLNDRNIRKLKIETEIKKAIEKNQLEIFYQPKFDLKTKTIVGMEALLRWRHPELGNISPFEFIPIAEETGCIDYIGEWVLEHACRQNKTWQDQGYPPLCVSVNASVRQFQNGDFVEMVNRILVESKLKPQYLEIEITESIMQNIIESKRVLNGLRALGVKASLDDFGTGYSSLHVLKDLPIDTIKIDKSFIDDVTDYRHQSVVKSIIDIGMNLNLNVVAEGIERKEQVEMLLEYECTIGQGYFFSKPVPVKSFEDLLKNELHRTYT